MLKRFSILCLKKIIFYNLLGKIEDVHWIFNPTLVLKTEKINLKIFF